MVSPAFSRKACASRSDTSRPMDVPFFFLSRFRFWRIGSSISSVILTIVVMS